MMKNLFTLIILSFFCFATFAQKTNQSKKECRISSGLGFAGTTENMKSLGTDIWVQLDYMIFENISIATDFENMTYKQPGYYPDRSSGSNEIDVYNNNFSLLLKYHFQTKSKLRVSIASGWTYSIRQNDYYIYRSDSTTQSWLRNVSSFSDYRIPFLIEMEYPISNKIGFQLRLKYNLNPQNGNTYSGGLGLSLKL